MGVTKLWQLLEEKGAGGEVTLSQCSGQAWAIDLSGWILHARTAAAGIAGISADHSMIKTVFARALCLLKHGVRPVFVTDGRMAPEVKSQTMQDRTRREFSSVKVTANDRSGLQVLNDMCCQMLESLGLQVVASSGEAEKTCALLNHQGVVDACLTDDSDCLLYGASIVYRNFDVRKETAQKHTLSEIQKKLDLTREDLIVMALLSGCDYGDGVKGIGPQKVLELIAAVKKYSSNVLQRVREWRDNTDLDSIEQEVQGLTKSTHCTLCQHPGTRLQHRGKGCEVCGSSLECSSDSGQDCPCGYHTALRRTAPYTMELGIRQKALKQDSFPDDKLVEEFLDDGQTFSISEVKVSMPQWDDLVGSVRMDHAEVMGRLVPVLVHMHLHGTLDLPETSPDSILTDCKRNRVPCYLVKWKRFAFDKWTPDPAVNVEETPTKELETKDPYVVAVPCGPMESKHPELVSSFKLAASGKKGKGKRPAEDKSQMKLTSFFKAKKVLHFEEEDKQ